MEPSARVEYALLALLEIASRYHLKQPLKISEIIARQPIPDRYLEQILTSLRRSGIVQSQRGARGGYLLSREPWQITLLDVIASVEGDYEKEALTSSTASSAVDKGLIYEVWHQARSASQKVLGHYTLQDLCQRRDAQVQTNPMYHI